MKVLSDNELLLLKLKELKEKVEKLVMGGKADLDPATCIWGKIVLSPQYDDFTYLATTAHIIVSSSSTLHPHSFDVVDRGEWVKVKAALIDKIRLRIVEVKVKTLEEKANAS